jgi:hypothetical protein
MEKIDIDNKALRILGAPAITDSDLTNESNESARILNDVYDSIRDEVLKEHPWNFAIKRATLTALGGLITTWTEEGTANVWKATLTTEPARVEFDGTEGTEQTSIAALTAARYWFWESNILYVYSTSDPDTAYTSPGVNAIIPEYQYENAYELPTDCLRAIRMEDDDSIFVIEGTRLLTNEGTAKIKYIAQITTESLYPSNFISAFAQRLAAEIAIPITNDPSIAEAMYKIYKEKLRKAKGMDAQEGSSQEIDESSWIGAR